MKANTADRKGVKCKLGMHDWTFIQSRLLPRRKPGVKVMEKYYVCRTCGQEKNQRTFYRACEEPEVRRYPEMRRYL